MKRSESAYSSWSARIISSFSVTRTVVGVVALAVAVQMDWPARHPSPKKSPGPRMATTASLPISLTTMYMTFVAGSPCAKTVSSLRNFSSFLPGPAEPRYNFTSNTAVLEFAFLGERRRLTGTRRLEEKRPISHRSSSSMERDPPDCPIQDTPSRHIIEAREARVFLKLSKLTGCGSPILSLRLFGPCNDL